ncbi:hypothetical protein H0H93_016978 [Arthromyces matolae]|nr:hypothetical protein H0H93_016978 [Arthromyces matolae]
MATPVSPSFSPSSPGSNISWPPSVTLPVQNPIDDAVSQSMSGMASMTDPTSNGTAAYTDSEFFLDSVIFKVEDTLFKVPKRGFLDSVAFFVPKFQDCQSENDIIYLDTVSKDEFRTLLRMLYPFKSPLEPQHDFTTKEWVTILELSTCWSMLNLRNMAISHLSSTTMTAVDRLVLGQKYSIPRWLTEGLTTLIREPKALPVDDDTTLSLSLDIDLKLKISSVRDSSRSLSGVLDDVDDWIESARQEFEQELDLPTLTSVQRLSLAQKYNVLEFLRPAYIELVERDEPLSDVEVTALGSKITAQICRVREYRIANMPHSRDFSVQEEVDLHFKEQLDSVTSASAIQRVLIAQKENVKEWLEPALVEVAQKHQLTNDDVGALGKDMILKLYRVREAVCATTWSETPVAMCAARVATEFIDEIVAVRAQAKKFIGTDEASEVIGLSFTSGLKQEAIEGMASSGS